MEVIRQGEADPEAAVFMPTWNNGRFLRSALESVLAQRGVHIECVVFDDCSSDGTWNEVLRTVGGYRGPHRVVVHRHARNDVMQHWRTLPSACASEWIVEAHGDDLSTPDRVARILEVAREGGVDCIGSNAERIDDRGRTMGRRVEGLESSSFDLERWLGEGWCPGFTGSTLAYSRRTLECFPPTCRERLQVGIDHILPFRGMLLSSARYLDETLIRYRYHAGQHTYRLHAASAGDERAESVQSLDCMTHLAMLDDLEHAAVHGDEELRRRAEAWRPRLQARVLELADRWMLTRNRLHANGRRGTWMDAGAFERKASRRHRRWYRYLDRISSIFGSLRESERLSAVSSFENSKSDPGASDRTIGHEFEDSKNEGVLHRLPQDRRESQGRGTSDARPAGRRSA